MTGTSAALLPKCLSIFQSDRTILNTDLVASRLNEILRKDVFSDIEKGPGSKVVMAETYLATGKREDNKNMMLTV